MLGYPRNIVSMDALLRSIELRARQEKNPDDHCFSLSTHPLF